MGRTGVILDSGGVLIRPSNGCWLPSAAFDQVLAGRGVSYDESLLAAAAALGASYLEDVHPVPLADEAAERLVWLRYYRMVLEGVGVADGCGELSDAIVCSWETDPGIEPYPWSLPTLVELYGRGVPVVVLSDAWPSLRRHYRDLGLSRYVRGMVISGEEGITKLDPRLFAKATGLFGEPVDDVVFVDD